MKKSLILIVGLLCGGSQVQAGYDTGTFPEMVCDEVAAMVGGVALAKLHANLDQLEGFKDYPITTLIVAAGGMTMSYKSIKSLIKKYPQIGDCLFEYLPYVLAALYGYGVINHNES